MSKIQKEIKITHDITREIKHRRYSTKTQHRKHNTKRQHGNITQKFHTRKNTTQKI